MPTYEYRCDHCARNFDVVQSFQDDPLSECPTCGNPVRKVFGSVGIVFKGSGFYKTDSRSGGGSASRIGETPAPAGAEPAATPAGSKESSTTDKPATPATPAPSPKVPAGSSSTPGGSSSGGSASGSSTAAPA